MSDYTPEQDERLVRYMALVTPLGYQSALTVVQEMTKMLAAEDIARRDGLAEQGETEWEYGFTSNWGTFAAHDRISAEQQASTIRTEIEAGRSSGDLKYHGRVMKRTTVKAGSWMPVPDTTGAESEGKA